MKEKRSRKQIIEDYKKAIPCRKEGVAWDTDKDGLVVIHMENTGIFNKIAQTFFKKPRVSHIHMEENGSFIWNQMDGERTVGEIGELVHEHFGEKAEPLYERMIKYFELLERYGFLSWKQ